MITQKIIQIKSQEENGRRVTKIKYKGDWKIKDKVGSGYANYKEKQDIQTNY